MQGLPTGQDQSALAQIRLHFQWKKGLISGSDLSPFPHQSLSCSLNLEMLPCALCTLHPIQHEHPLGRIWAALMGSCSTQLWSHRPLSISLPWKMRRYVVRPSLFVRKTLRKTGLCGKIWKTETQHFLQSQMMTRVMELDRKPPLCAFPQHPLKALRRDLTTKSLPTFRRQHHSIVRLKTASQMHVAPRIVWSTLWNGWRGNEWRLPLPLTGLNAFVYTGLNAQKL